MHNIQRDASLIPSGIVISTLKMIEIILITGFICFGIGIMGTLYLHVNIVLPTLEKYGKDSRYLMTGSAQQKQLDEYKKVCIENNLPLTNWKRFVGFQVTMLICMIVMIICGIHAMFQ